MAITIYNEDQSEVILQSTTTIESGEWAPRVFFSRNEWRFLPQPRWVTNKSSQRKGNFKYYNGEDDRTGMMMIILTGSTRNANLEILRDLDEVIYLDADDINSNDSGKYVMWVEDTERDEAAGMIKCKIKLEAYNND